MGYNASSAEYVPEISASYAADALIRPEDPFALWGDPLPQSGYYLWCRRDWAADVSVSYQLPHFGGAVMGRQERRTLSERRPSSQYAGRHSKFKG